MTATELRWILIIIGLLILAGIFFFGNPNRKSKGHASRRRGPQLPDLPPEEPATDKPAHDDALAMENLQQELKELGDLIAEDRLGRRPEEQAAAPEAVAPPASAQDEAARGLQYMSAAADKIVTLFIKARHHRQITGVELLDAAIKAGLVFGDMDIFHRVPEGDDKPIFSMANLVNPGTFDKTSWNTFETPGVALFMMLPGQLEGLDTWDSMLATAQRLGELLNADVMDESQCLLTRQRVGQIREELREYDRKQALVDKP